MQKFKNLLFLTFALVLFAGCATKQEEEYNKPDVYWYNKMLKEISLHQLDNADETFIALEAEHRQSPYLSSATMLIGLAHMDDEEYILANYYFDEYIKRFEKNDTDGKVRYLKIRAKFLAFKQQFREQKLLDETISDVEKFKIDFPKSSYIHLVKDIESRLLMGKSSLNIEIADLYKRIDKPLASEEYAQRGKKTWENQKDVQKVVVPWYRAIFE
ncbi:MAG: outer membrane protein assembly factor BamD [Epsilonproteobacteria bacterium]|nr:outer membrane protein assembly factor BamD [Campylobacterota bacterium]